VADAVSRLPGQALHAASLGFVHPATGERVRFETNLPKEMNALIALLEAL
jgi:23S rRNA pseudouridine1911/1915/1917 synthase